MIKLPKTLKTMRTPEGTFELVEFYGQYHIMITNEDCVTKSILLTSDKNYAEMKFKDLEDEDIRKSVS